MKYEIDFMPVGEESKGGDAICFRYWDDFVPQFVCVIDGGNIASGELLVEHIKSHYKTETVDLVINTHPHADHTSGLYTVLENLTVRHLIMHKPWEHAVAIRHLFHDGRITANSIDERVRDALQHAHDLHELAIAQGVEISEPFAGVSTPSPYIQILSPTMKYYQELLLDFTATPKSALEQLMESLVKAGQKVVKNLKESWDSESLVDPVEGTNPENNSSVVTLLTLDGRRYLFTGDAGVPALELACDVADYFQIPLKSFRLVQVPHHGSKRNVGPTILNRLIGEPVAEGTRNFSAYISVPKKGEPKHPSKRVMNAFTRRGADVVQTKGVKKYLFSTGLSIREGWEPVEPEPLHLDVDDDESD
jgi:beta-lactamase superfamily II metal-dependent hydrolase